MAAMMKFLCLAFICSLIIGGDCQCSNTDLDIKQSSTGMSVNNFPEFSFTLTNKYPCDQLNIQVYCNGFAPWVAISPAILSKSGDKCILNGGQPIHPNQVFSFNYVFRNEFPFTPVTSNFNC